MTHRSMTLLLFMSACVILFLSFDSHAEWVLSVTGASDSSDASTSIQETTLGGTPTGIAGHAHRYLGVWPGHTDPALGARYYAAYAVADLYVSGTRKSDSGSWDISGDLEVKWTWEDEEYYSAADYTWDYSIKGQANVDARVELKNSGGYGKAEAYAEVKLEASGVDLPAREAVEGVSAGAEVRSNGFAFTGFGLGADGFNVSWQPNGQQLEAVQSYTRTVTLSDIKRPGTTCWIKAHTLTTGTLGSFHDTYRWDNGFSASAYMIFGVNNYSLYKLEAPVYNPE